MAKVLTIALAVCGLSVAVMGCTSTARSAGANGAIAGSFIAPVIATPSRPPPAMPIATQISLPYSLPVAPPPLTLAEAAVAREKLLAAMHASLGGVLLPDNPALTRAALIHGQAMAMRLHADLDAPQVLLLVDRSPAVQRLWIVYALPDKPWESLGSVHVSTGKPGRKEHFRTPVGLFVNDGGILGYRALGTFNEFHIRGIGLKGMRVWDFGWQTTDDWRTRGAPMAVRMEMHATDPANLELRLGRWDSEGCIRIPSKFNSWLDNEGLIDAKLAEIALTDRRFAALLPKGIKPNRLAGSILVVVDTSDPGAAPSDPVRANELEHPANSGPEHDDAG